MLPWIIGTLSKDVFEPRKSTGSEAFSLFICLDANKLVLLSFFSLLKTIYPRVSTKSFPSDVKSPLPVDVRRSKTLTFVPWCFRTFKENLCVTPNLAHKFCPIMWLVPVPGLLLA